MSSFIELTPIIPGRTSDLKARLKVDSIVMYMASQDSKQTIITTSLSVEGKGFGVAETPEEIDLLIAQATQKGGE